MVTAREWERVQRIERKYHENKDPEAVLPVNLEYWSRILRAVPAEDLRVDDDTRVLDIGCGGAGILLRVEGGRKTGVDPLMSFYLDKFPFLREQPVDWVEGTAEQFLDKRHFDIIFSINMLDHVFDPRGAAGDLERLLAPGGRLIVLLNVHTTRLGRWYIEKTYRWTDPPHPHHIHRDDVADYFPSLELRSAQDVDHLWLDLKSHYDDKVLNKKRRDRGKTLKKLLNPFLYPMAFARLVLKHPYQRRRKEETPLQAAYLYTFAKAG